MGRDETVASFRHGIQVIRSFTREHRRQTITEVAGRTGLSRSAARRLLLTLCDAGLARTDGKYFQLTAAVLGFGQAFLEGMSELEIIRDVLLDFTHRTGESASAAMLVNTEVIYVTRLPSPNRNLPVAVGPGFRRPAHATSIGQVLLFANVIASPYYLGLGVNTLLVAAGCATAAMLLTIGAGWIAARRRPGGAVIDQLVTMPLVFPGLVLGVALLEIALQLPIPIYGTLWLIGIAFLIRYMPYGMRYTYTGVLQVHPELEQAAGVAGATTFQTLRRVVMPLLWPAIASGWLFIFLIAAKEMSLPLLLAGPNSQTVAVAMFDLWSNGQGGEVAALGLLWAALMTVFASFLYFILRRQSAATFGG